VEKKPSFPTWRPPWPEMAITLRGKLIW